MPCCSLYKATDQARILERSIARVRKCKMRDCHKWFGIEGSSGEDRWHGIEGCGCDRSLRCEDLGDTGEKVASAD